MLFCHFLGNMKKVEKVTWTDWFGASKVHKEFELIPNALTERRQE